MKRVTILACILALTITSDAQVDSETGSQMVSNNHFDIVVKTGTIWGHPFKSNIQDIQDRIYELEVDYTKGTWIFSAFAATCIPEAALNAPDRNQYECGMLFGVHLERGRSILEAKTGPIFMSGEYCVIPATSYSQVPESKDFKTLGGLAELSYRYHLLHHMMIGLDVPITLNRYFYYGGGVVSVGYIIDM